MALRRTGGGYPPTLAMVAALRLLLPEAGIAETALTNRYPAARLLDRVATS